MAVRKWRPSGAQSHVTATSFLHMNIPIHVSLCVVSKSKRVSGCSVKIRENNHAGVLLLLFSMYDLVLRSAAHTESADKAAAQQFACHALLQL